MMSEPWLTIIGLGEDGPAGLPDASRKVIAAADVVFGAPRHLDLMGIAGQAWPVPFDVAPVLAHRGKRVVVLASGDPFWFGAGGSLMAHLRPGEWVSHPVPGTFALAANVLGWRLEDTLCLGLHAAPLARLRPVLGRGVRVICLLRDAAAVADLAAYLPTIGQGDADLTVLECLGGPRQRVRAAKCDTVVGKISVPVAVAIEGRDQGLPAAVALPDDAFAHDGQITKRPVRALTLAALAPRAGEVMWDIGAGSGSVGIVWLLSGGGQVHAVEGDATRAARAAENAASFGLTHRYTLHHHRAPEGLHGLPRPDSVFVGGGASAAVLETVWQLVGPGTRIVVNAVTLETESLLATWSALHGGSLLRIDLAEATPLGAKRGWRAAYPVVQWSVTR